MKNLKVELPPLKQTQKVRFERAMELIKSLSSTTNNSVIVADSISVNHKEAFLKGHGTSLIDGDLLTTVCGVVINVDKLVYVRTLRARYKPEVGDIVVGRVIQVAQSHWKVELNSTQDGVLKLSSINMPDSVQKRMTSVDELNMRNILVEDDVLCAQVGETLRDGSLQLLLARSHKYGKLDKGQLLKVDPYLVKRSNLHFHFIETLGIDLILGRNGFIWVGEHAQAHDPMVVDDENISSKTRQNILRIGNAIRVLSNLGFTVTLEVIMETFNLSIMENIDIHDMVGSEFHVLVTENQAERRRRCA
ncbi:K Homology domain type 1 superfamily [Arabidopsis thaliana x Arabidopsis arenosa]|uniref:K Homology domain type 1 superfamily n=1 Tax=Arabidopsis thaliana x Arabidopsis arenosa TaxID=1240361 RepID=A0A8T2C3Q0_9BRAS|nr:K Homology domain type 1 superfamily [Arabidopsis thaliana x Arabidopsis arenosa]